MCSVVCRCYDMSAVLVCRMLLAAMHCLVLRLGMLLPGATAREAA